MLGREPEGEELSGSRFFARVRHYASGRRPRFAESVILRAFAPGGSSSKNLLAYGEIHAQNDRNRAGRAFRPDL